MSYVPKEVGWKGLIERRCRKSVLIVLQSGLNTRGHARLFRTLPSQAGLTAIAEEIRKRNIHGIICVGGFEVSTVCL